MQECIKDVPPQIQMNQNQNHRGFTFEESLDSDINEDVRAEITDWIETK